MKIAEGDRLSVQTQGAYYRAQWRREGGQSLPPGIYQDDGALRIDGAQPEHSGTYYWESYGPDNAPLSVPYEIHVQPADRPQPSGGK